MSKPDIAKDSKKIKKQLRRAAGARITVALQRRLIEDLENKLEWTRHELWQFNRCKIARFVRWLRFPPKRDKTKG